MLGPTRSHKKYIACLTRPPDTANAVLKSDTRHFPISDSYRPNSCLGFLLETQTAYSIYPSHYSRYPADRMINSILIFISKPSYISNTLTKVICLAYLYEYLTCVHFLDANHASYSVDVESVGCRQWMPANSCMLPVETTHYIHTHVKIRCILHKLLSLYRLALMFKVKVL